MALETSLPALVNGGSGFLLVALGIAVATVRPRSRATLAFATFAMLYGLRFPLYNLVPEDAALAAAAYSAAALVQFGAVAALLVLVTQFPERLEGKARWSVLGPTLAGIVIAIALAAFLTRGFPWPVVIEVLGQSSVLATQWSLLFLLVSRFVRSPDARLRRQYALFTFGLMLYPTYVAGSQFTGPLPLALTMLTLATVLVGRWLHATAVGPQPATARNLALAVAGVFLVGMLSVPLGAGPLSVAALSLPGLLRVLGVAILAYAVLRAGLFGLDVKVRWTIRQSTLGAVFVAVFFVVSEGTQTLLSEEAGPVAGVLVAGGLVFILAPLQRLAERVATAAVPHGAEADRASADARREAYRSALLLALKDGHLTREEERHLARVASGLGLGHEEALDVRDEIERSRAAQADEPAPSSG